MNLRFIAVLALLTFAALTACDSEPSVPAGDSGLRDATGSGDLQIDLSAPTDPVDGNDVEPSETGEVSSTDALAEVATDITETACEVALDEWSMTMQEGDLAHFGDSTVTSEGNVIFAGNGTTDAWVLAEIYPTGAFAMSVHPDGCLLWATLVGLEHTSVRGVAPTPDGGAVVTGLSGDGDLWAARFNTDGTVAWQVAVGEEDVEEEGEVIVPNPSGGFWVLGRKGAVTQSPSVWLVSLTEDGRVIGEALTIAPGYPVGLTVVNDGLVVLGRKPGNIVWLVGLDSSGSVSWNRQFSLQRTGHVRRLVANPTGELVAVGVVTGADCAAGCSDVWTATFNNSGELLDQAVYDIGVSDSVQAAAVSDEGMVLVGQTDPANSENSMWIGHLGNDSTMDWHATIAGAGGYGTGVASLNDGSFVIAGEVHRYGHPDHRIARFGPTYTVDPLGCPPMTVVEASVSDGVLDVDDAPQLPDSNGTEVIAVVTDFEVIQWESPFDLVCGVSD